MAGNHEESVRKYYSFDVHTFICGHLDIYNMGYVAFSRLRLLDPAGKCFRVITCFTEHGSGGGTTIGGKWTRIDKRRLSIWANILAMGHVHKRGADETIALSLSNNNNGLSHLIENPTVMLLTGTYLRTFAPPTFTSYSEKMAWSAVPLGCKGVKIQQIRERHGKEEQYTIRLKEFSI